VNEGMELEYETKERKFNLRSLGVHCSTHCPGNFPDVVNKS
jgi:hypothetical protein